MLSILSASVWQVCAITESHEIRAPLQQSGDWRAEKREDFKFAQLIAVDNLITRQSKPGMNVCYGSGAICGLYLDLQCPLSASTDEWYECICQSGYLSTQEA